MSYLGVDVGTTGCKAVAFDNTGNILAHSYYSYPLIQSSSDLAELDPNLMLEAIQHVIRDIAKKALCDPIKTIAFSVLGEAVTPVDKKFNFLSNSVTALDRRSLNICHRLNSTFGKEYFYKITGQPIHTMYTIGKILWWKENSPEIFNNTYKFLCWEEILYYKFCHQIVLDYSLASRTMCFDIKKNKWSSKILDTLELSSHYFGEALPSGTSLGIIDQEVAHQLGLSEKTLIVIGGFDQACAALGAKVLYPGTLLDSLGTTHCLALATSNADVNTSLLRGEYSTVCHVIPKMFLVMGGSHSGGIVLKWYIEKFKEKGNESAGKGNSDFYSGLFENFDLQPSKLYFLPYLVGSGTPDFDPLACGALLGIRLTTNEGDIIKSIIEGICYEMRINIDYLQENGFIINQINATGGAVKSEPWLKTKSNIANLPVQTFETSEGGCLGCAILGAVSCGDYKSIEEAVHAMIKVRSYYYPQNIFKEQYDKRYLIYRKIRSTLSPLWKIYFN